MTHHPLRQACHLGFVQQPSRALSAAALKLWVQIPCRINWMQKALIAMAESEQLSQIPEGLSSGQRLAEGPHQTGHMPGTFRCIGIGQPSV